MREEEGGLRGKPNMFEARRHIRRWERRDSWSRGEITGGEGGGVGKRDVWKWLSGKTSVRRARWNHRLLLPSSSSGLHSAPTRWLASSLVRFLMLSSKEPTTTQLSHRSGKTTFHYFMCREGFFFPPITLLSLFKYVFLLLFNETDIHSSIIVCQSFRAPWKELAANDADKQPVRKPLNEMWLQQFVFMHVLISFQVFDLIKCTIINTIIDLNAFFIYK